MIACIAQADTIRRMKNRNRNVIIIGVVIAVVVFMVVFGLLAVLLTAGSTV